MFNRNKRHLKSGGFFNTLFIINFWLSRSPVSKKSSLVHLRVANAQYHREGLKYVIDASLKFSEARGTEAAKIRYEALIWLYLRFEKPTVSSRKNNKLWGLQWFSELEVRR